MEKIAVIGAGVMGKGVAQIFLENGYEVILIDITNELLQEAKYSIKKTMLAAKMLNKNVNIDVIDNLKLTTYIGDLKNVKYVIENITESLERKIELYKKLDRISSKETIFLANTSCISITKIGSVTKRPDKVIGVHFMNPAPLIKTVEIIKGYHTSDETIETIKKLLLTVGKDCAIVNDYPGFVSNRISHLMMNEAAFVVQEQVAAPEVVDDIFKNCYSHKMGPLETADLIGLDTVVNSLDVLYEYYGDSKFRCCPLLRKMVDAGLFGRKTGEGFYKYN